MAEKTMWWQRHGTSKFLELYINTDRGPVHYAAARHLAVKDYGSAPGTFTQHSRGWATYQALIKQGYQVIPAPDRAATLAQEDAEFTAEQQEESA